MAGAGSYHEKEILGKIAPQASGPASMSFDEVAETVLSELLIAGYLKHRVNRDGVRAAIVRGFKRAVRVG